MISVLIRDDFFFYIVRLFVFFEEICFWIWKVFGIFDVEVFFGGLIESLLDNILVKIVDGLIYVGFVLGI